MHLHTEEPRIRTREIEELEDAKRAAVVHRDGLACLDLLADHEQFAGQHLAVELRADEVERARLRRDNPVSVEAAQTEWPHPAGVAERDQLPLAQRDHGERA